MGSDTQNRDRRQTFLLRNHDGSGWSPSDVRLWMWSMGVAWSSWSVYSDISQIPCWMGRRETIKKMKAMNEGWYILLAVTLIGYNGEKQEVDLTAGYPVWHRTVHEYPNAENPHRNDSCKDRWLKVFNEKEKSAESTYGGRYKATHWIDAKFKFKRA